MPQCPMANDAPGFEHGDIEQHAMNGNRTLVCVCVRESLCDEILSAVSSTEINAVLGKLMGEHQHHADSPA